MTKKMLFLTICSLMISCNNNNVNINETLQNTNIKGTLETESSEHLTFNGIPIDGTLEQFVTKMVESGFTFVDDTLDYRATLLGSFAGKDCIVYVYTHEKNEIVSNITIFIPGQKKWAHLYDDYISLKEMLTGKYGQPYHEKERFLSKSIKNDQDRMLAVKQGNYEFGSCFVTDKGEIILCIDHQLSPCVLLRYKDKINSFTIK